MHYDNIRRGTFLARPNRFIAHVALEGTPSVGFADSTLGGGADYVITHVKNTGRCRELLVPGAVVYLQEWDKPERKTKYDLIAVEKGARMINMDAQAPNKVFGEWAAAGNFVSELTRLRPETTYGKSRFDFYWEAGTRHGFVEVKGVTLEEDGAVYFPDAPTERGVKHVEELAACRKDGYEACLFLVIQMKGVKFWSPNDRTHPAFGAAVRAAAEAGVQILAYDCNVTQSSLALDQPVEVRL